jgi:oxygen-independent coproporphyrinogen-3 oxidase
MSSYSLYLHIPFCRQRCAYCDFNTYAGVEPLLPAYVAALCEEIRLFSGMGLAAHTVYFGGGTPSLLQAEEVATILDAIQKSFALSPTAEISLEANPGSVTAHALKGLRAAGVNRLSLGVQSALPRELTLLGRQHTFAAVIQSMDFARQAGFDSINLDLIFGIPGQSLTAWQDSLHRSLDLAPEHLSLYALTIETGTPFDAWLQRGLLAAPDPDLAADQYEWACLDLAHIGYAQYEISNWARPGRECQHNLQYWRGQPYLGLGAGAHGYAADQRTANVLHPADYIRRMQDLPALAFPQTPATDTLLKIDRPTEMAETMIMGLRLTQEGITRAAFRQRFGQEITSVYGPQISRLTELGLLEWAEGDILRLTPRGRLLGNQVFLEFI